MSDKAFVAGATGLTGRYVVEELRRRGIETVAHVRPDSSRREEWTQRFEGFGAAVDTTAWDQSAMAATMEIEKPTLVFGLLGTTRRRKNRSADPASNTYEAVDYGLTHLLYEASRRAGTPRFVYLSSLGVDSGAGAYITARRRIEAEMKAGPLPWTSIRPAIIHGDRDEARSLESLGVTLGDGAFKLIAALGGRKVADKYRSILAPDLAAAMVRWALDPTGANRILETEELR